MPNTNKDDILKGSTSRILLKGFVEKFLHVPQRVKDAAEQSKVGSFITVAERAHMDITI